MENDITTYTIRKSSVLEEGMLVEWRGKNYVILEISPKDFNNEIEDIVTLGEI